MGISIEDVIKDNEDNFVFPDVAREVVKLIDNDDVGTYDLVKPISHDAYLSVSILKIANSSYYGFKREVKTINDAITILGFAEIKKLIILISVKSIFAESDAYDRFLWEHSLFVGIATSLLNKMLSVYNDEGVVYLMGLLHDIGKNILKSHFKADYIRILDKSYRNSMNIIHMENDAFGFNHTDVGFMLMEAWEFPVDIVNVVKFHHDSFVDIGGDFKRVAALVNIADFIANAFQRNKSESLRDSEKINNLNASKFLSFKIDNVNVFVENMKNRFYAMSDFIYE